MISFRKVVQAAATVGLMGASPAMAQIADSQARAPRYSLFWPVPHTELRALGSDRPGNGENPFTMDPGHFQIEIGAVGFTHVGYHNPGAEGFSAASSKLRVGVVRGFELQGMFDGFSWRRSEALGWGHSTGGFGGRAKINLFGDYSGSTALALIPSLTFAPREEGGYQANGGLVATFAGHLPAGWGLFVTVGGAESPRADGTTAIAGSGVIGFAHAVQGPVSVAIEVTGLRADTKVKSTEGRLGAGLMAPLSSSFQVDAGLDVGFTYGADAVRAYFGLVRRF